MLITVIRFLSIQTVLKNIFKDSTMKALIIFTIVITFVAGASVGKTSINSDKKHEKRGLLGLGYGYNTHSLYGSSHGLDSHSLGQGLHGGIYSSGLGTGLDHLASTHTVLTKHVAVPYPQYIPIEKHIGVPVKVPYPVDRPVPVYVEKHVPVVVEKRVPIHIDRPVPYPVKIPVKVAVPVIQKVGVPVPQPYPVHIEKPVFIEKHSYGDFGLGSSGYLNNGLSLGYNTHHGLSSPHNDIYSNLHSPLHSYSSIAHHHHH